MLAIVCPGQGSQKPGFLAPWLEMAGVRDQLESFGAVLGLDLVHLGTEADAETLRDTAITQPLIVAAGLMAFDVLAGSGTAHHGVRFVGAGHSVGEITAAAITGALTAQQALTFVRERGRAMAAASAVTPTGMSAVLGGDPQEVTDAIRSHGLTPANINAAGQVVAAGTMEQLAALAAAPPARCRVIPLQVAGAFHTTHMEPAQATLREEAARIAPRDPDTPLLSNRDGQVLTDAGEVLARLVSQVANPVRWDLCSATLAELGVTALIELPPAGTLTGLAKRALPGVALLSLNSPDQLDEARELIAEHAGGATA